MISLHQLKELPVLHFSTFSSINFKHLAAPALPLHHGMNEASVHPLQTHISVEAVDHTGIFLHFLDSFSHTEISSVLFVTHTDFCLLHSMKVYRGFQMQVRLRTLDKD